MLLSHFHTEPESPGGGTNEGGIEMRDQLDARDWIQSHDQFSNEVGRLLRDLKIVFCKMADIQFRAPWRRAAADC